MPSSTSAPLASRAAAPPGRRPVPARALFLVAALTLALLPAVPSAASTTTVTGVAFADLDRDGTRAAGEEVFAGHVLYLFDADGTYLRAAQTDTDGRYTFSGVAPGTYEVRYAATSWWPLREEWVPTTTGGTQPARPVSTLAGSATADFGWRPVMRSHDLADPISEHIGPEGLRVASYNDAVSAREVYEALLSGLVGDESPHVTVRFGWGNSSTHAGSLVNRSDGTVGYQGTVYASYLSWLDGRERTLVHEYGHAWSHYHAFVTQGEQRLDGYLEARGLLGDERLGTSYAWDPWEIVAEDYRQLLGSPATRDGQINGDIPRAADVPGLESYLRDTFTTAPAAAEPDPGAPTRTEPGDDPVPDPSPEPAVEAPTDLVASATKVKGTAVVDLAWRSTADLDVDVLLDGRRLATVRGGQTYRHETGERAAPAGSYQVCVDSTVCSASVRVGSADGGEDTSQRKGGPKQR